MLKRVEKIATIILRLNTHKLTEPKRSCQGSVKQFAAQAFVLTEKKGNIMCMVNVHLPKLFIFSKKFCKGFQISGVAILQPIL